MKLPDNFYRVGHHSFASSQILSVKKAHHPSKGYDGVLRNWIIQITPEAAGTYEKKFHSIWASQEEARDLLMDLELIPRLHKWGGEVG